MRHLAFALVASLAALGCGGGMSGSDDDGSDYPDSYNCATETRADAFSIGLDKAGAAGLLDFKMMGATPAPPMRDDNAWVIQISSRSNNVVGAPESGLESDIDVSSYMPDHGHVSPVTVKITPTGTAGQYNLSPVNLWMPGLWQTTIQVDASGSGGTKDKVVFAFCIAS